MAWPIQMDSGYLFLSVAAAYLPPGAHCSLHRLPANSLVRLSDVAQPRVLGLAPARLTAGKEGALTWPVGLWGACGSPGGSSSSGMWGMAASWREWPRVPGTSTASAPRCSKRPGLRRLRRRQKDKSNPLPSLTQAGFHFQEP